MGPMREIAERRKGIVERTMLHDEVDWKRTVHTCSARPGLNQLTISFVLNKARTVFYTCGHKGVKLFFFFVGETVIGTSWGFSCNVNENHQTLMTPSDFPSTQ